MSNMYNKIDKLCKKRKINITVMCKQLSIPRSCLSELNQGRSQSLSAKYLNKIADYFDVSVGYLMSETEDPTTDNGKGEEFTVYTMGDKNSVETINSNRDTLADLTELMEVVRKLPQEKIKALLNIAKLM